MQSGVTILPKPKVEEYDIALAKYVADSGVMSPVRLRALPAEGDQKTLLFLFATEHPTCTRAT